MRIAYFDCIAGISGDMALGALLDAGVEFEELRDGLAGLPLEPFSLEVEEVDTRGQHAMRVSVTSTSTGVIRTYASIRTLLESVSLPPEALALAQRIFRRLAEAEARVHRREVDHVVFHEVGAVDSIVDITGFALGYTMLGIERAFGSPVPTGMGMTRTEHGLLPIPAPAVVELLRGVPMHSAGVPYELVTPTGAAILASVVEGYGDIPMMRVDAIGYGAGTHRLDFPNVLRILVGDEERSAAPTASPQKISPDVVLQTNIDDLNPELYEYVLERLLAAGAQDAWLTPIVMKKSRPAVTVSVLCSKDREEAIRGVLFRETGTLGVRSSEVQKVGLDREVVKVETSHGPVAVKVGFLEGKAVTVSPEYEDAARVAREAGIPARDVYEEAVRLARRELDE